MVMIFVAAATAMVAVAVVLAAAAVVVIVNSPHIFCYHYHIKRIAYSIDRRQMPSQAEFVIIVIDKKGLTMIYAGQINQLIIFRSK